MQQNTFDLVVQLQSQKSSLVELIYYGRLFQLPINMPNTVDNEI